MIFKFDIANRPECAEEAIGLEMVKECRHGRRYHRARIGTAHYESMVMRLWPNGRTEGPVRLHTPAGEVTVVADRMLADEAFLETVPAEVCRERARRARKASEEAQAERQVKLEEPGRQEWSRGKWVERCERAAADGQIGMTGSIDISGVRRCSRDEVLGIVDGFRAAAAADGFEARFLAVKGSEEIRMEVLWDKPLDKEDV